MARKFNFSAGPAMLPTAVIERAQQEMPDWNGSGMSVMEMSHRGKDFGSILESAEADLGILLGIPPGYRTLFLQGGQHPGPGAARGAGSAAGQPGWSPLAIGARTRLPHSVHEPS